MCWSAAVSIGTYAFSALSGLASWYTGENPPPVYWNFIHMQLAEYLMWKDQDCSSGLNAVGTAIAAGLLATQPICAFVGSRIEGGWKSILIYTSATAWFSTVTVCGATDASFCTVKSVTSPHLSWAFLPHPLSPSVVTWMSIFYPCLFWACKNHLERLSVGLGSAVLALSVYHGALDGTWGSGWCWWANFAAVGYLYRIAKLQLSEHVSPHKICEGSQWEPTE